MKTIKIKDYYGIYQEIPVSDELYEEWRALQNETQRVHRKEVYSLTGRAAVSKTVRGCSSRPIPAILLGCRQAVKAPVSDTGICWFESNHPSHTWRVNPEGLGTAR